GFIHLFMKLAYMLWLWHIIRRCQQIEPSRFGSGGFSRLCADRNGTQGDDVDRIAVGSLRQTEDVSSDFGLTAGKDDLVIPQPLNQTRRSYWQQVEQLRVQRCEFRFVGDDVNPIKIADNRLCGGSIHNLLNCPVRLKRLVLDFSHHTAESNGFPNEGVTFQRGLKFDLHNRRGVLSRQRFTFRFSEFDVPVGSVLAVNLALRFRFPEQFRWVKQ